MSENRIRNAVLTAISTATSLDELGRIIVETCAKEFRAEVCSIWRYYRDDNNKPRLRLLAASAKAPQTLAQEITYEIHESPPLEGPEFDGVTGYVAQTRNEVHVASNEQLHSEYGFCWSGKMDRIQWEGKPANNFHSLSAFPLVLGEKLLGVFKLENKRRSRVGFPKKDRSAFHSIETDIALSVNYFMLLESYEERFLQVPARMMETLLGGEFDTKHLISEIVRTAAESVHAEICSLWLVDPSGKELRLADGYGFPTEERGRQVYQLASPDVPDKEIDGLTAWVAVRGKPFWANSWEELMSHPSWRGKWDPVMWHQRKIKFRCLYSVPLIRQDTVVGVLKVENRIGGAFFTDSDRVLCQIMATFIVLGLDLGNQMRSSLISELVHIIRSPIGQVSMNLTGLEDEVHKTTFSTEKQRDRVMKYIEFMKTSLFSATVTSRTLVAFAQQAEAITPGYEVRPIVISVLVENRIKEIRPLLYRGIKIQTEITPEARATTVNLDITDDTRVQIIIDNIVHNAIKYSREKGLVYVRLYCSGENLVFEVEDFGLGIPEDGLPRIFEAGYKTRAPGHPEGTGMGLTTVKQIVDRLKWKIDVSSTVGVGTKFKILIPVRKDI